MVSGDNDGGTLIDTSSETPVVDIIGKEKH
jgi:hypothetical protein